MWQEPVCDIHLASVVFDINEELTDDVEKAYVQTLREYCPLSNANLWIEPGMFTVHLRHEGFALKLQQYVDFIRKVRRAIKTVDHDAYIVASEFACVLNTTLHLVQVTDKYVACLQVVNYETGEVKKEIQYWDQNTE